MWRLIYIIVLTFLFARVHSSAAQTNEAPCGVVDAIDYPVESVVDKTIARGYDDFGLYRTRFGGYHVAIDVAFREQGEPVRAAARGRVTYADIEGWDTEGGVIIIEHVFPDGNRYFTLYGHVEESETIRLPDVGECVEIGDPIAAVGAPSLSAPHLHFEVRDFAPGDGGPGYVDSDPLQRGWYHPLDFIQLWQLRLSPAFVNHATFEQIPTLPPVRMGDGLFAIGSGETVSVATATGTTRWNVTLDDVVTGIAALPGNRVVARSRSGQTVVVSGGRYQALWIVEGPDEPFAMFGETLIFVTPDGGLAAYDPSGTLLWSQNAPPGATGRIVHYEVDGSSVALGVELEEGYHWRLVDTSGETLHQMIFETRPLAAPVMDGSWMLLADDEIMRITNTEQQTVGSVDVLLGRTARLAADVVGNTYLYAGDFANTLLSWDASAQVRWETTYPASSYMLLPPLLQVDTGCLLYVLDQDGQLNLFNTADGLLAAQTGLYPGGAQTGRPNARLLATDSNGHVHVSAGFLSLVTLDGHVLGGDVIDNCRLG